jgi:hypothetical protein
VKSTESSCPFCSATLATTTAAAIPTVKHRMTRAAAYAFGASLAVTGCVTGTVPDPGDGGTQGSSGGGGNGTKDGGGGGSKDGGGGGDKDVDEGNIQPPYGAPAYGAVPVDSGND